MITRLIEGEKANKRVSAALSVCERCVVMRGVLSMDALYVHACFSVRG